MVGRILVMGNGWPPTSAIQKCEESAMSITPKPPETASSVTPPLASSASAAPPNRRMYAWLGAAVAAALVVSIIAALVTPHGATPGAANVVVPTHQMFAAAAPVAPAGASVTVQLTAKPALISIAPSIAYHAWTFNGTVPGPIIRVRVGQTVHFTLTNDDTMMAHSIDFHAAQTPPNVNYRPVLPGKSLSFDFMPRYPGVFMYHCGVPPVLEHIANGMYGAIIVDLAGGYTPATEYMLVQSEFYLQPNADGSYSFNQQRAMNGTPDYTVFNGYAGQYQQAPLAAKAGQPIRIFIVNAGPSNFSAFHVIGAIFTATYADGNPANQQVGNQTITIPPGGAAMVELTIPDPGGYPFVTHSFADASRGAVGVLSVTP